MDLAKKKKKLSFYPESVFTDLFLQFKFGKIKQITNTHTKKKIWKIKKIQLFDPKHKHILHQNQKLEDMNKVSILIIYKNISCTCLNATYILP